MDAADSAGAARSAWRICAVDCLAGSAKPAPYTGSRLSRWPSQHAVVDFSHVPAGTVQFGL